VVAACGIWCFGFQVVGMVWSWGLCVRSAGLIGLFRPRLTVPSKVIQVVFVHLV
jgi:hypothetical protein